MFVKKVLPALFLVLIFYFIPTGSFAQTACCSQNGGVYACDYSTSKLYCRDGTVSKDCTCKKVTYTPTPSPKPTPVPTLPFCVPHSTYDKSLKGCKCDSGYIVSDNSCITYQDFCWQNFGGNSSYDKDNDRCVCSSGYAWDGKNNTCISLNKICQNNLGSKSYYNSEDKTCNCFQGYYIKDGKCSVIPTPIAFPTLESKIPITSAPYPIVSEDQNENISSPSPTFSEKEQMVKSSGDDSFVTESKPQKNLIIRVLEVIWHLIINVF